MTTRKLERGARDGEACARSPGADAGSDGTGGLTQHDARGAGVPWRALVLAGILTSLVTLMTPRPMGEALTFLSYDSVFLFRPEVEVELVIIEMDQKSYTDLKQIPGTHWDRELHARLVARLTEDQAKLIVFDVLLADDVDPAGTLVLAEAFRKHGRVVAGFSLESRRRGDVLIAERESAMPPLAEAFAGEGFAGCDPESDGVVRRMPVGSDELPSLSRKAAELAGADLSDFSSVPSTGFWLRFYGSQGQLQRISYSDALTAPAGRFHDQLVFVGNKPMVGFASELKDQFRTPLTRWGDGLWSGVDLHATAFLNLLRAEWLSLLPGERFWLLGFAFVWGMTARALKPMAALYAGLGVAVALGVAAPILCWTQRVWFAWLLGVVVTVPAGLGWSWLVQVRRLLREAAAPAAVAHPGSRPRTAGGGVRPDAERSAQADAEKTVTEIGVVADHELLTCVGEGAYGEVWLARNAIGLHHAVKIVRRSAFPHATPYEREFRGIQRFMPISRQHPNLVQVLHVGRNDRAQYFYYVMELGDDETGRFPADSAAYTANNLAKVLRRRKRLSVAECLDVVIPLASALEFLHKRELVHRDIKPSNIIFVDQVPKLADIGLVTDAATEGRAVTYLGTEGYIAPEGPGTPAADVFSLGKVLYEMSMGLDRLEYPHLPTAVVEHPEQEKVVLQLNDIILKACEPRPEDRLGSAAEFLERCQVLQRTMEAKGRPA